MPGPGDPPEPAGQDPLFDYPAPGRPRRRAAKRRNTKGETDVNAREKLEKIPPVTDWNRTEGDEGDILSGPLVRVTEDEYISRDNGTFFKHALVIADDHDHGKPKRVQVEGREFKAWFKANQAELRPGAEVAVRFDGEETNDDYTWRNYTVSPDVRDGDEFEFKGEGDPGDGDRQGRRQPRRAHDEAGKVSAREAPPF